MHPNRANRTPKSHVHGRASTINCPVMAYDAGPSHNVGVYLATPQGLTHAATGPPHIPSALEARSPTRQSEARFWPPLSRARLKVRLCVEQRVAIATRARPSRAARAGAFNDGMAGARPAVSTPQASDLSQPRTCAGDRRSVLVSIKHILIFRCWACLAGQARRQRGTGTRDSDWMTMARGRGYGCGCGCGTVPGCPVRGCGGRTSSCVWRPPGLGRMPRWTCWTCWQSGFTVACEDWGSGAQRSTKARTGIAVLLLGREAQLGLEGGGRTVRPLRGATRAGARIRGFSGVTAGGGQQLEEAGRATL